VAIAILKTVWGNKSGYVFVPRRKDSNWDENKPYKYPDEWEAIKNYIIKSAKSGWDIYWCPLLFTKPKRIKSNALPSTNLLWADLDLIDPATLDTLKPSITWKSSDTRYQALWFLDNEHDIAEIEEVNKALTYKIGADKGGWDIGQVIRIPGSPNYKYNPPQKGKVLWAEAREFNLERIKIAIGIKPEEVKDNNSNNNLEALLDGWSIPERIKTLLFINESEVEIGERSDKLWEIEISLLESGLPILTVIDIITMCPWNKFKGRKNEREQIYNEVLKADKYVKTKPKNRETINTEIKKDSHFDNSWAISFSAFTSKKINKPEWLVEGIWQHGTYGMIAGEPKTYKSIQATDLALSVASGRAYLNYFPVQTTGTVLYVQEENNEQTVQDRVFKIASSKGLLTSTPYGWQLPNDLPLYFSNNYGINLTDQNSKILLEQTIQELNPILLILDPLYMMLGGVDENSATEVSDILKWLTYLRNKYGLSIMVCHHYNKSNTSSRGGQRVRGSSAFHAWVESAMYIKSTTELYTVKIEREFRAFPTLPELVLKIELGSPGNLMYVPQILNKFGEAWSDSLEVKIEEVCTFLSSMPRTEEELEKLCKITRLQLSKITKLLINADRIIKMPGGGRNRKTIYILK